MIPKILDPASPSVVDETKTKYLGGQFISEIDQEFYGYIFGKQERENVIFGDLWFLEIFFFFRIPSLSVGVLLVLASLETATPHYLKDLSSGVD